MATAAPKTAIATPAALTTEVGAAPAEEDPVAALLGTLAEEAERVVEAVPVEEAVEERAVPVLEPEDVIPVDAAPEAPTLFTTLEAIAMSLLRTLL